MTPRAAMVFAAGFGTRMGDLTAERPKPLLPVAGTTLLDHALDQVADAGIERAVVNLHYKGDMIRDHLSGRSTPEIRFSEETPDILDTGGGIVAALDRLGSDAFATMNADTVFLGPNPLSVLAEAWTDADDVDALLLMVEVERTVAYTRDGDFFVDADRPVRRGSAPQAPFVYAGAQIIRPGAFADPPGPVFSLNVTWDHLLEAGRMRAVSYPGRWVDVGTPDGLAEADALLSRGQ